MKSDICKTGYKIYLRKKVIIFKNIHEIDNFCFKNHNGTNLDQHVAFYIFEDSKYVSLDEESRKSNCFRNYPLF